MPLRGRGRTSGAKSAMLLAVVGTLGITALWIHMEFAIALVLGTALGVPWARAHDCGSATKQRWPPLSARYAVTHSSECGILFARTRRSKIHDGCALAGTILGSPDLNGQPDGAGSCGSSAANGNHVRTRTWSILSYWDSRLSFAC